MSAYDPPNQNFGSAPPPKKSGSKTILIILGVIGVLSLLCCGGVVGMGYFGFSAATGMFTAAATQRIEGSAEGSAAIGTVQSAKMNFVKTGQAAEEYQGQANIIVLDIVGSEGSGEFVGQFQESGQTWRWAKLKMADGTEIDLDEPSLDVEAPDFAPMPGGDATSSEDPVSADPSAGTTN